MLKIRTQGVKGHKMSTFRPIGFVEVNPIYGDNRIMFDDFEGQGNSYTRKEQPEIRIMKGSIVYFKGTFDNLINALDTPF